MPMPAPEKIEVRESGQMRRTGRRLLWALALLLASLALFLFRISQPPHLVFDEDVYIQDARAMLAGEPTRNPEHPPLAKEAMAIGIRLLGDNARGWRAPGAVVAALTVAGVYFWTLLLVRRHHLALWTAALTALNGMLFVMARTAMLDVYTAGFTVWALAAFTAALEARGAARQAYSLAAGALFGLALAAKWVALGGWFAAIGAVAFITVLGVAQHHPEKARAWQILPGLVLMAPVAYFAAYAPAFWIMHQPFSLAAVAQAQVNAWRFHHGFVGARWAGSPWYSWPLKLFPQYLILERERSVVFLGNPVVMWGGLAGLLVCLGRLVRRFRCPTSAVVSTCGPLGPELIVVLAYAGLLLQWSAAPARTTFYYYYLPAAMMLGPALAVAFAESEARQWRVFGVALPRFMLLAAAAAFALAYPFMAAVRLPGAWFPK